MFACLVSGELVQTECAQVSENQFLFNIEKATAIRNLAVFMTGSEPFAEGFGAIVHFAWPPYDNWQVLGYLTNAKPSAIFAVRQQNALPQAAPSNGFSYQNIWQTSQQQQVRIAYLHFNSIACLLMLNIDPTPLADSSTPFTRIPWPKLVLKSRI